MVTKRQRSIARTARPILLFLLAAVLIATQVTALAHEIQHVSHEHEGPCALHVAADHLAMASPPAAISSVPFAAEGCAASLAVTVAAQDSTLPHSARAPPVLS